MLKIVKNDYEKWSLLLSVLSEELSENSQEFQNWLADSEENRNLYQFLKDTESKDTQIFDLDKMYENISKKISFPTKEKSNMSIVLNTKILKWMKYAAILILFAIPASVFLWINKSDRQQLEHPCQIGIIEPGSKKAKLTIADDRTFDLTNDFNIRNQDGTLIINELGQGLSYEKINGGKRAECHILEVPNGGEYELKLSDGTKVYLNSGSRISYPSFFTGNERKVELTGEAYFEVAKNIHPFIVHTHDIDVKVLGTSFNICAYESDAQINTTLVSGKVEVYTLCDASVYTLTPGYNLNYRKEMGKASTQKVDIDLYISWTRGEFVFYNQNLEDIFTKLSRWYDFQIEYTDQSIRNLRFTGSAEKKRPINYLLKQIEMVTNLKFKEDGRQITIYR
jgi:ferric-dicitrate binding protein FerR (iron transport regulator)